jgi:hypothetical protein
MLGIIPMNLLLLKSRSYRFLSDEISPGSSPSNWLLLRLRICSDDMLPTSWGTKPVRLLEDRIMTTISFRFPKDGGIRPDSEFLPKSNISRPTKLPISTGITPVRLLV